MNNPRPSIKEKKVSLMNSSRSEVKDTSGQLQ